MKTLKEYWNQSYQRPNIRPVYDDWLDKYAVYLNRNNELIVDLGCGIGNNFLYLSERGFLPTACDISEEALKVLKQINPDCNTLCFDMAEGLPFDKKSVRIMIADLSLHYFDEKTTREIIENIHNVLREDGVLLCRLNSIREIENKGEVEQSNERFLFMNKGIYRRFFDLQEIENFFSKDKWEYFHLEEYELLRYSNKKVLWEIAMKPKYVV